MDDWIKPAEGGTSLLFVWLTPKASQNKIKQVIERAGNKMMLSVSVTAPPDKNKANDALIRLISSQLDLAMSQVGLMSGHTSRQKVLHLALDPPTLRRLIEKRQKDQS